MGDVINLEQRREERDNPRPPLFAVSQGVLDNIRSGEFTRDETVALTAVAGSAVFRSLPRDIQVWELVDRGIVYVFDLSFVLVGRVRWRRSDYDGEVLERFGGVFEGLGFVVEIIEVRS